MKNNYFNFKFKYSLLNKFSDVWNIKSGDIFEIEYKNATNCYRAHKFFSGVYNYIYVGAMPLLLILLFLTLMGHSILLGIFFTLFVYLVFEFILIAFVPIVNVDCLDKKIEDKKRMENKWQY